MSPKNKNSKHFSFLYLIFMCFSLSSFAKTHVIHDIEEDLRNAKKDIIELKTDIPKHYKTIEEELKKFNNMHQKVLNIIEKDTSYKVSTMQDAVTVAKESNAWISNIFTLASVVLGMLVFSIVWIGIKDREDYKNNLKETESDYKKRLKKIEDEYKTELSAFSTSFQITKDELEKSLAQEIDNLQQVVNDIPSFCVAMYLSSIQYNDYTNKFLNEDNQLPTDAKDDPERISNKSKVLKNLDKLIDDAKSFKDNRSVSLLYSRKALMHHFDLEFDLAIKYQLESIKPKYNLLEQIDRIQNICCMFALKYKEDGEETARQQAISYYSRLIDKSPDNAKVVYDDPDFEIIKPLVTKPY